ncbi:hypothetical protein [Silvimonas sp.]|uniref:hypothetical protein n=1 Tax=Silvimonas sp. TaxID=2650811 RepID=UPI00283AF549|nr:hypothetical protein [Silvimonas sp.]MDR3427906.1 hypothetical protein [Silvimonas sp.]
MAQGLQVFDAGGRLTVDVTHRLTKVFGASAVSGNGSLGVPGMQGNTPFYFFVPNGFSFSLHAYMPSFTWSGNTLSWSYNYGSDSQAVLVPGTVYYGSY